MSTNLDNGELIGATLFSGPAGELMIQVTLTAREDQHLVGESRRGLKFAVPYAYQAMPLDDFRRWLAEVSAALERIEAKGPVPAHGAGGEGEAG